MSKTIEGIPEFFTREQYLGIFEACGVEPAFVKEMRLAPDGVHVIVFATTDDGRRRVDLENRCYYKHRIFIPVRQGRTDERVARVTEVRA